MTDVTKPAEQIEKLRPQAPDKAALEKTVAQAAPPSDQVKPDIQSADHALKQNLETSPSHPEAGPESKISQSPELQRLDDPQFRVRDVPPHTFADEKGRAIDVKMTANVDSASGSYRCYKAYDAGAQVGELHMNFEKSSPHLAAYDQAKINMVEVSPSYRGAGIGEHMVKVGESSAQASGVDRIYGDPVNDQAQQFFSKQEGWQIKAVPQHYYGLAEKRLR